VIKRALGNSGLAIAPLALAEPMTEDEWNACSNASPLLEFMRNSGRVSDRKLRLFACACCRRSWELLHDERLRNALDVAERYVDGLVSTEEWRAAAVAGDDAHGEGADVANTTAKIMVADAATAAHAAATMFFTADDSKNERERAAQANLLRDIFGPLPFRAVSIVASCVTPDVLDIAKAIYEERDAPAGILNHAQFVILAGCLTNAGCNNEEILAHLHQRQAYHVRGCWVLDLLLSKS